MLVHVGVDPVNGQLSYFDETKRNIIDLTINSVEYDKYENISLMFNEIRKKVSGTLGCACICLYNTFGNETRKKFIESGIICGFKSVKIINFATALFLHAVSNMNHKILNGSIIWVLLGPAIYIWKIYDHKAKFIDCSQSKTYEIDDLRKIAEKSKTNTVPDLIIYNVQIHEANFNELFACQFFSFKYNMFSFSRGSYLKTKQISNDRDFIFPINDYFLSRTVALTLGNQKIISYTYCQQLPIKTILKAIKTSKNDELKINNRIKNDLYDRRSMFIEFQIDANEVYSVAAVPSTIITISHERVLIFNPQREELIKFPASIDYGSDLPKIGVGYQSATVISDIIKNFCFTFNSPTSRAIYSLNGLKRFYVLKIGDYEKLIDNEMTVIDLLKEAINRSGFSKEYLILTIPLIFSDEQKVAYLKAAENAGFSDVTTVDEQVALAFGVEEEYALTSETEYLLINFNETLIKISLNKAADFEKENCLQKTIHCENMVLSKSEFFDGILNDAENELINENDALKLQNLVDAVNELIEASTNMKTIVITSNELCAIIIHDICPATFNIIFIENPEEIIVKGAAWA